MAFKVKGSTLGGLAIDIGWSLLAQFGAGYSRLRDFRAGFIGGVELALAVYPEAQVSVGERGITLKTFPTSCGPDLTCGVWSRSFCGEGWRLAQLPSALVFMHGDQGLMEIVSL